ncbi:UNVERIFIED_CONTAM: hypothetical protein Sradi_3506300 [Sesamum radiatum]|uniref:Myb/SANT-like domain-containing protein n=1 Tax=Sesamum radiatum TaxID=300843 RepID=A0AAW2QE83_SESRA
MMQHQNDAGSSQSSRSDKVVWTTEMERVFIELMHEEFTTHRLQSSTFPPWVWARLTDKMNSIFNQNYMFTTAQLKGKLNRLRHSWRLLNNILTRGTGWGWDSVRNTITDDAGRLEELYRENSEYKKIVEHGLPQFDLCTKMFSRNTAVGGLARGSSQPRREIHCSQDRDDEQMDVTQSGSRRSRDEYEDTAFSQSPPLTSPGEYSSSPQPAQTSAGPSGSGRRVRRGMTELNAKKCETMDMLNESMQGKIDRTGPKATESIERCVDELTKFADLPDIVFTTALERFHSHSTRTIFLRLNDENKLRWLHSLNKIATTTYMASSRDGDPETNSNTESPRTPGTPGSNESDVSEEFYTFRDFICPELFRDNVPRNTSALQGAGWIAEIMTTPHPGRFFDNIRMTKPCFYALVDALTSRVVAARSDLGSVLSRKLHSLCKQSECINDNATTIWNAFNTRWRLLIDCVGAIDGTLVPAWVPRVDQNRYRSRKGRLAQNVLAICDFDMNFTYVYAGWEGSAADARVLDHAVSQDPTFPFPPIGMAYRRYLESVGFPQEDHWTLNVEQRLMWMIVDDNTRMSIRDDEIAEAQMGHWARGLRRHFGYPYTRDQVRQKIFEFKARLLVFHALTAIPGIQYDIETLAMTFPDRLRPYAQRMYPLARRYFQYPEPLYPSMLEVWGPIRQPAAPAQGHDDVYDVQNHHARPAPVRGGPDAPIVLSGSTVVLSDSTVPLEQSHTHIASWDAVENVARGDGHPRLGRGRTVADRRSLDMGSEVGELDRDRLYSTFRHPVIPGWPHK